MACEDFVQDLRKSSIIKRGQLDGVLQLINKHLKEHPDTEPGALGEFLIAKSVITSYQAETLLQGRPQSLAFGPYVILDRIGPGVVGTVYKTFSKHDEQFYWLEVLPQRAKWNIYLAYRQKKAFAEFVHPAVVPFVDVGTSSGQLYLVWPEVEGERLDQIVQRNVRLKSSVAADYIIQAAEGLHVCHTRGVFHGLLKPSSILRDGAGRIRVIDFGIGSLLAEKEGESLLNTMSTSNALTAALDCASPESLLDPSDRTPLGDQYSLGCVLYFALTGKFPFAEENTMKKLMAVQYEQPTPLRVLNSTISQPLEDFMNRVLQKNPQDRFHDMLEFAGALRAAIRAGSDTLTAGAQAALAPTATKTAAAPPRGGSGSGVRKAVGGPAVQKRPPGSGVRKAPAGSGVQRKSGVMKAPSGVIRSPVGTASAGGRGPDLLKVPADRKWLGPVLFISIGLVTGILGVILIFWLFSR